MCTARMRVLLPHQCSRFDLGNKAQNKSVCGSNHARDIDWQVQVRGVLTQMEGAAAAFFGKKQCLSAVAKEARTVFSESICLSSNA